MAHRLFQVGIKAIVCNEAGEVLLLQTAEGPQDVHWDLPGGRIEDQQTITEALNREIQEEIGTARVSDIEFLTACIANFELTVPEVGPVGLVLMAYTARISADCVIALSDEHTAYEWVMPREAAERLTFKYPEEFCRRIASL